MRRHVRWPIHATVIAAIAALSACTPTTPGSAPVEPAAAPAPTQASGPCDAAKVQWLVGLRIDDAARERARSEAGARRVRVLAPNQAATMEFDPERLDIATDDTGLVTRARCG